MLMVVAEIPEKRTEKTNAFFILSPDLIDIREKIIIIPISYYILMKHCYKQKTPGDRGLYNGG